MKLKEMDSCISIGKVVLANKPLSNIELVDAVQHLKIPNFRGVCLRDTLPKRPNQKECGILNSDSSNGRGTHWVAWLKKKTTSTISIATEYNLLTK